MRKAYVLGALIPLLLLVVYGVSNIQLSDTDRYYHLAITKLTAEANSLFLRALPQADNVGWGENYVDKAFLFHVITTIGNFLAGESGVIYSVLLFTAGVGLVLFAYGLGALSPGFAFCAAFVTLFSHSFLFRMLFLRPYVMGVFWFVLLVFAILRKKPYLAAAACFAFILSYHAFYIPLATLGLAALAAFSLSDSDRSIRLRCALFGAAGLLIGILVNPYFPGNFLMALLQAKIPLLLQSELQGTGVAYEVYPLSGPGLMKFYAIPGLIFLTSCVQFGKEKSFEARFLLFLTGFFALVTFKTVRGGEYFVPASGFLLMALLARIQRREFLAIGLAAVQLFATSYIAAKEWRGIPDKKNLDDTVAAIQAIPPGAAKVYNCEWDTAAFLLYHRPDLKFVEALDPVVLFKYDNAAFRLRQKFHQGLIGNPQGLLQKVFRSQYVLCRNPRVVNQLDSDPSFRRVFPPHGDPTDVALFAIREDVPENFVKRFRFRPAQVGSVEDAKEFVPDQSKPLNLTLNPKPYIDLGVTANFAEIFCGQYRADDSEIRRLAGARYLGLGGGQAMRAWRNGKLVYASGPGFLFPKAVQAVVPLASPVKAGERWDFLYCAGPGAKAWGAAVSFWSEKDLADVCAWKRGSRATSSAVSQHMSSSRETCLGPLAAPAVDPALTTSGR